MKTFILIIVSILLTTSILSAQTNFHNIHYIDPYNPEYVKGEVLVKFKDEMDISHLQMGMYIVAIKTADDVITRKVIKNY